MNDSFSKRSLLILTGMCTVSLLAGLALAIFQEELSVVRSAGSDSFSYSALGHRGFKTLLEDLGYQVLTSRNNSANKTDHRGLLILAEPNLRIQEIHRQQQLQQMCTEASNILIVLPKYQGYPDSKHPSHLKSVSVLSESTSQPILQTLGLQTHLRRVNHSRKLQWTTGSWTGQPFIENIQLLPPEGLVPLLASPEGVLLGRLDPPNPTNDQAIDFGNVYLLTDPDLLANHGLHQGNNADLAVRIIDLGTPTRNWVVFDETLHGHEVSPSLFRSFFRIPLVFILLQVLLTAALLLWTATRRFGSPVPPAPTQKPGLDLIIDNTAELLDFGGHGTFVLGRFFQAAKASVCRRLHLDLPENNPQAQQRLVNLSKRRCPTIDFPQIRDTIPDPTSGRRLNDQEILNLASAVHRWQQEMTHG